MTRVALGLLLVLVLTACTPSGGGTEADEIGNAERFKAEMDAFAKELLPDLAAAVDGELRGMHATFYERGSWGIWDYRASGRFTGLRGTATDAVEAASTVLEAHGMTLVDNPIRDVAAHKGDVSVTLTRAVPTEEGSDLEIEMSNVDALESSDAYAEDTPPEDYLAFLQ